MHKKYFPHFLITAIGIIIYSNTFYSPFVLDDWGTIIEDMRIRSASICYDLSDARYIAFLTFALNYYLGGLSVLGYHIVNLAIHILNALLVYWLVVLTFRTPFFHNPQSKIQNPQLIAFFSALLFVSHPIQTQAVTYITQRFASLATLFYLLSLVLYIKWRLVSEQQNSKTAEQQNSRAANRKENLLRYCFTAPKFPALLLYCASLFSAILAMKTKEIAFTLPVVITLYEFMFFDGRVKKRLLYLIPLIFIITIIPLNMIVLDKPIGDTAENVMDTSQAPAAISRLHYFFTQLRVVVTYGRLLIFPINQNLIYDYPKYNSFFEPQVFLSFLFLLSIFGLGVYLLYRSRSTNSSLVTRHSSLISFGIFWFFITLSIESGFIPIKDVIFEHRLYLPSVGFFIAFISAVFFFILRFKPQPSRFLLSAANYLLTTVILIFSVAAYQRNSIWGNEISLWSDVAKKSPNKGLPHNELGSAYFAHDWLNEAVQEYKTALKLRPHSDTAVIAHNNLGMIYIKQGRLDKAIEEYKAALEVKSGFTELYKIHNNLGKAYAKKGLVSDAAREFQAALSIKPDLVEAQQALEAISK